MNKLKNIKILISPEKVRQYYDVNKNYLVDTMDIIAKSIYDDYEKACFLFVTDENDEMLVSLESCNEIIDSWTNPSVDTIKNALIRLNDISK